MSYSFIPMTDDEIDSFSLLPEGTYNFEVVKATRKMSKSNNPMAELNVKVWDKEGKEHIIFDYLVFSQVPLNIRKVKHFCEAVGLQEEYKRGQLPEELEHMSGQVLIGIRDEQPKQSGGFYPKKNIVLDYITKKDAPTQSPAKTEEFNDDIPF